VKTEQDKGWSAKKDPQAWQFYDHKILWN